MTRSALEMGLAGIHRAGKARYWSWRWRYSIRCVAVIRGRPEILTRSSALAPEWRWEQAVSWLVGK